MIKAFYIIALVAVGVLLLAMVGLLVFGIISARQILKEWSDGESGN